MQAKKRENIQIYQYLEIYVSFLSKRGYNIVNFVHKKEVLHEEIFYEYSHG